MDAMGMAPGFFVSGTVANGLKLLINSSLDVSHAHGAVNVAVVVVVVVEKQKFKMY